MLKTELEKGQQNKKTRQPNTATCSHLSKKLICSQSVGGKSSPGRHIKTNTIKNQAMPGINFLKDILFTYCFVLKSLKLLRIVILPAFDKLLHPLMSQHLRGYLQSFLSSSLRHTGQCLLIPVELPKKDLLRR